MVKRGRPIKTLSDLPEDWQGKILALAKKGGSDVEVRAKLGVSIGFWYRLLQREPQFWCVVRKADEIRFAWWLKEGRGARRRPGFNSRSAVVAV